MHNIYEIYDDNKFADIASIGGRIFVHCKVVKNKSNLINGNSLLVTFPDGFVHYIFGAKDFFLFEENHCYVIEQQK